MKISLALIALLFFAGCSKPDPDFYIASVNSYAFHRPTCGHVKTILPDNQVRYENREAAIQNGKTPCGHCKP